MNRLDFMNTSCIRKGVVKGSVPSIAAFVIDSIRLGPVKLLLTRWDFERMRAGHVDVKPVRAQFVARSREMARVCRLVLTHPRSQFGKVFLRQFLDRAFNFFHSAHIPKITERAQSCKGSLLQTSLIHDGYFEPAAGWRGSGSRAGQASF